MDGAISAGISAIFLLNYKTFSFKKDNPTSEEWG